MELVKVKLNVHTIHQKAMKYMDEVVQYSKDSVLLAHFVGFPILLSYVLITQIIVQLVYNNHFLVHRTSFV